MVYYGDLDEILDHMIESTGIEVPPHENPADCSTYNQISYDMTLIVMDMINLEWEKHLTQFYMNQISIMWATGGLMITAAAYYIFAYIALYFTTKPKLTII